MRGSGSRAPKRKKGALSNGVGGGASGAVCDEAEFCHTKEWAIAASGGRARAGHFFSAARKSTFSIARLNGLMDGRMRVFSNATRVRPSWARIMTVAVPGRDPVSQ